MADPLIAEFNRIVVSLNGLPLFNDIHTLKNTRLEPYALVILFYQLARVYPLYTYEVILPWLSSNPSLEMIRAINEST